MTTQRLLAKIIIPLLILLFAVVTFVMMKGERKPFKAGQVVEQLWTVSAQTLTVGDIQPRLKLYGQIIAGSVAEIRAPVKGYVEMLSRGFRAGAIVHQGDELLAFERFDFDNTVAERKARLDEAMARLDELTLQLKSENSLLQKTDMEIALRRLNQSRFEGLKKQGKASQQALDDSRLLLIQSEQSALRQQQEIAALGARIQQQQAIVRQHESALEKAQHELQRTLLKAPFDGFVVETHTAVGSWLSVGETVGRIIDAGRLEVQFRLGEANYARLMNTASPAAENLIGRSISVLWRNGAETLELAAEVERTSAQIKNANGGVSVYARLLNIGLKTPLRPGAFVEVELPDRVFSQVARMPVSTLVGKDQVFVVEADRVQLQQVSVVHRNGDEVFIRPQAPLDWPVVLNPPAQLGPGAKVRLQ